MAYVGIAKVQHYVPAFLLRNFGTGKKNQLYAFDKKTGKSFSTKPKNIAAESRFYDFEINGAIFTLEQGLSTVESKAKQIIDRLLKDDRLTAMSNVDYADLAGFMAIQHTRTRWFRDSWKSLPQMLAARLREHHTEEQLKNVQEHMRVPDENQATMETAKMIMEAPETFGPHFINKTWVLLQTDRKHPFIIGDNPVSMQNSENLAPMGNIGLNVVGIEIYLPLSPTRTLGLWCPTRLELMENGLAELKRQSQQTPYSSHQLDQHRNAIEHRIMQIKTGALLECAPENVMNVNSLQIAYAERQVFSSVDDFALVREMVLSNPSLRVGPRMKMN